MRVANKIVYGFGILILLMAGLVVVEVVQISRMQNIIHELSTVNFEVASAALELSGLMAQVDEYAQKSLELGDPDYERQFRALREQASADLVRLQTMAKSEREQTEIKRLAATWESFLVEFDRAKQTIPTGQLTDFPPPLAEVLRQIQVQTENVYRASSDTIRSETQRSLETGQRVKLFSWITASIALVLSCFVSFVIVQSISRPLKQLTQGTRAIAQGKFFFRLDTSHNDEFAQLAKDFNTMSERLNELDQMKKDFVAHVSHELKSPLASMRETIQLLLDKLPGELSEKQRRLLELNLQSAQRLSTMISNLLDLSRMEAGVLEYELKTADLPQLVRTAVEETEPLAQQKGLRFAMDLPENGIPLECDEDRIIQVLKNLLINAVRFSPNKADILVRVDSAAEVPAGIPASHRETLRAYGRAGYGLVAITDSGPGVPDEHKERIFEKFHQVRQGKKMPGQGAGLGLAISKTIVEAHRGTIWVEDNPSGGSVFELLLPLGTQAVRTASTPI